MKSRKMQKLCQGYPSMAPHRILSRVHQSNWGILAGYRNFCSKPDGVGYPGHIFKSSGDYYKFLEEAST
jgi:curved DNA-binding protein CbpA